MRLIRGGNIKNASSVLEILVGTMYYHGSKHIDWTVLCTFQEVFVETGFF